MGMSFSFAKSSPNPSSRINPSERFRLVPQNEGPRSHWLRMSLRISRSSAPPPMSTCRGFRADLVTRRLASPELTPTQLWATCPEKEMSSGDIPNSISHIFRPLNVPCIAVQVPEPNPLLGTVPTLLGTLCFPGAFLGTAPCVLRPLRAQSRNGPPRKRQNAVAIGTTKLGE